MVRKKKNIYFIIVLLVAFLGIGYAYLTTTLSINGTTDVDENTWDVHFANIQVTTGSVTGNLVTQAPTIGQDQTSITFQVRLSKPGDYYEFTVDAVNGGTIDAMIEDASFTINDYDIELVQEDGYLGYAFTYDDDMDIEKNQILKANESEKYKARVEYRTDIDPYELPTNAISLEFSLNIEYVQATSQAIKVREYVYTVSEEVITIGEPIPDGVITYDNYQDAIDEFGHDMFIRHKMCNGIVKQSSVGFIYNNQLYYMRGGDNGKSYEQNKALLDELFGSANCGYHYFYTDIYYCGALVRAAPIEPLTSVAPDGWVSIGGGNNTRCSIRGTGNWTGQSCCIIYPGP